MCATPCAWCAGNGDNLVPGRFSVDKWPVVRVLSTGLCAAAGVGAAVWLYGPRPLASRCPGRVPAASHNLPAVFCKGNGIFPACRTAQARVQPLKNRHFLFFQRAWRAARAAVGVCLLCTLYSNSSSSRGLQNLWTTWFFCCDAKVCIAANTVCAGLLLLPHKVDKVKNTLLPVDKWPVVPLCSTGLCTGTAAAC